MGILIMQIIAKEDTFFLLKYAESFVLFRWHFRAYANDLLDSQGSVKSVIDSFIKALTIYQSLLIRKKWLDLLMVEVEFSSIVWTGVLAQVFRQ